MPLRALCHLYNDVINIITQCEVSDQTGSSLKLEKLWDKFSEAANSVSQFILTIIFFKC